MAIPKMTPVAFKHFPSRPPQLTADFVRKEYGRVLAQVPQAEQSDSVSHWSRLVGDWNALRSYCLGEEFRIQYELAKDMKNQAIENAYQRFQSEVKPPVEDGDFRFIQSLLKSRHKASLKEHFGSYLFERLEAAQPTLEVVNSELRVKDRELGTQYSKLVALGEVVVNGKTITLSAARDLQTSEDPSTRRQAFEESRKWFLAHHDELAGIYDQSVHLRDQMGRNLGYSNFIPLGYAAMNRTDYGPEEAARFREGIRKYATPLLTRLHRNQARNLGTPTLRCWDAAFDPSLELPTGVVPVGTQFEQAQKLFDTLSPRLGAHFQRMRNEGLIDLENRPGKQAGAFCTSFPDEGRVAILCNSTGSASDVGTLTHEMGHAFQAWESQRIELTELQWPTSDAAEIHSMGMEFLAMRHIDLFFGNPEHARKFSRKRWKESVELSCYIAIVDEFQHWAYENPKASFSERDQAWSRIWDIYMPGIDFSGVENYKYARWYAQGHIFRWPFYYIDYAIAELGAMQLALIDHQNPKKALETYLRLCEIGGTRSVLNIFKAADMRSPFEPELIRDLMEHAEKAL